MSQISHCKATQIRKIMSVLTFSFFPSLAIEAELIPAISHKSFFISSLSINNFHNFLYEICITILLSLSTLYNTTNNSFKQHKTLRSQILYFPVIDSIYHTQICYLLHKSAFSKVFNKVNYTFYTDIFLF